MGVSFAYRNTKHVLKHKVAVKREAAVTKDMNKELDSGDKKISRKEKDERILWKKNEVAEYESTTFSIFYNNCLFFLHSEKLFFSCQLRWSYDNGCWSRGLVAYWLTVKKKNLKIRIFYN